VAENSLITRLSGFLLYGYMGFDTAYKINCHIHVGVISHSEVILVYQSRMMPRTDSEVLCRMNRSVFKFKAGLGPSYCKFDGKDRI
jgi:hypothetical protein